MELRDHIRAGAGTCDLTIRGERQRVEDLTTRGSEVVAAACRLASAGAVATVLDNSAAAAMVVLGAIDAGLPLISLPARPSSQAVVDYGYDLDLLLSQCGDVALVGLDDGTLAAIGAASEERMRNAEHVEPTELAATDGFALVQFTSGTTGRPRGLVVSPTSLMASITATLERISAAPGDQSCSWLPLGHDMGLVGMFLTPLVSASPQLLGATGCDLMAPTEFLRKPARWLDRLASTQATVTAAPDSALRHVLRVTSTATASGDLGRLRSLIVGGEVNRPSTMAGVTGLLTSLGASAGALCPAYGMAEAGLAVSVSGPGEGFRVVSAALPDDERGELHAWVAAGAPLSGYQVEARDPNGRLDVAGPGLANSYLDGTPVADADGFCATSDIGRIEPDGSVIVMGRVDDTLVLNGRNVSAALVDRSLHDAPGVRAHRAYACMLTDGSWALVAELKAEPEERLKLLQELRRRATVTTGASPDVVVAARANSIPFTTSGKLQRSKLGRLVASGDLPEMLRL